MGTTLDGSTLTVTKWSEGVAVQASQWDAWSSSQYKRKVKVYGIVRTYTITFVENNVSWASSLALKFETDAVNGSYVTLYSDSAQRPVNPGVSVYVLGVQFDMENLAGKNVRKITVTVQEAQ
jgi:hypothetical protein